MSSSILYTALLNSRVTHRDRSYGINICSINRTKKKRQWCSTAKTIKKRDAFLSTSRVGALKKRRIFGYSYDKTDSKSSTITIRDVVSRCWTKKDRLKQIKSDLLE